MKNNKKYCCRVSARSFVHAYVYVTAKDEKQAKKLALKAAATGDWEWSYDSLDDSITPDVDTIQEVV